MRKEILDYKYSESKINNADQQARKAFAIAGKFFKLSRTTLENEIMVEAMDNNLLSKSWDRIIRTNRKGNYTNVYLMKGTNNEFVGLTIVSL
ncbi:MAG: hypothetical protein HY963_04305, partial [Ignavibacteriales bacterium]|nr:hypothetical protein [Ignavibacteriales bacterium]